MLIKSTTGKVLTDTQGRMMTTKDRWHPLVVDYAKRVIQDGGKIETPALEEMNTMAWNGDFDDALFAFFACGRKAGKLYSLIGDDIDFERNSNATEWEKYGGLRNAGNDLPVLQYFKDKEFKGALNRVQDTNYYNRNSNHNWDVEAGTGTVPTVTQSNKIVFGYEMNVVQVVKPVGDGSKVIRFANFSIPSASILEFGFFFKINSYDNPMTATPVIQIRPGQNTGNGDYYIKIYELPIGEWIWLYDGHPALIVENKFNSIFADRTTINCWFNSGNTDFESQNTNTVFDIEIGSLNITMNSNEDTSNLIYTTGSMATRLADDIADIAVPAGASEIRSFVNGVETIVDSGLPANWEFPLGTTKYVIIK